MLRMTIKREPGSAARQGAGSPDERGWVERALRAGVLRESQKGFQLIFLEEGVDGGAEGCEEEADQHDQPCIGT